MTSCAANFVLCFLLAIARAPVYVVHRADWSRASGSGGRRRPAPTSSLRRGSANKLALYIAYRGQPVCESKHTRHTERSGQPKAAPVPMADSFRAIAASKRLAAAALEARFDHLTSGPPSPRKPKPRGLTAKERRDQAFRLACGAYVKGATKAGAKLYADIQEAEKLLAAETARGETKHSDSSTAPTATAGRRCTGRRPRATCLP